MTDLRKAAEMALEALDSCEFDYDWEERPYKTFDEDLVNDAVDALRQALAQGEPIKPSDLLIDTYSVNLGAWSVNNRGVKITHVPTGTVVCSDSERSQHANKRVAMQKLEAALAQPEQEPVARVVLTQNLGLPTMQWLDLTRQFVFKGGEFLYTAPPSKPWVSLTDEERDSIARDAAKNDWHDYVVINATEAKLKEKNNG